MLPDNLDTAALRISDKRFDFGRARDAALRRGVPATDFSSFQDCPEWYNDD
jgi:hypothetical protein